MRTLRPYQKTMLHYMRKVENPALFVEMRLGKTLTTIRWAKSKRDINRVLVVCPYSAFNSWLSELAEENEPEVFKLVGSWSQREVVFNTYRMRPQTAPRRWSIINKEGFLVCGERLAAMDYDTVILDESPFIKNPQSKVSKFYTNNFRNVKHRAILTGTPAPEGELEYFQQLYFLDPDILGFDNYWSFRHRLFIQAGYDYIIKNDARKWLGRKIAEHCFTLKRDDVDMGVDKVYETRSTPLTESLKQAYKTLEEEFVLEYGELIKKTIFATQRFIWMRRMCGGFVERELVHKAKLAMLDEVAVGELAGQQIVVWCSFIDELKIVAENLNKRGNAELIYGKIPPARRNEIIQRFQCGEIRYLVAQPECFKHGVKLSAADVAVYYSTPMGLETRMQSEDRIIDVSKSGVLILDLVMEGTIDEDIVVALQAKERKQQMMKRIIDRCQANVR